VNSRKIREKFGDDYIANEHTFTMGIDYRFTTHIAERFRGLKVLETCTGAGFTTISLARVAAHVITVEIKPVYQSQARKNVEKAGLLNRVTFLTGDILNEGLLDELPLVDAAFIDPEWDATGPDRVHRFVHSNTRPPADALLERILRVTENVAIVLPPSIDIRELEKLPLNECQKLYMGKSHELYCLYFGNLITALGDTKFRVQVG
jgi:tRNA1(Val) A37 N6-methylase TrmN6